MEIHCKNCNKEIYRKPSVQDHSRDHIKENNTEILPGLGIRPVKGNKIKSSNSNKQLLKKHLKDAGLDVLSNESGVIKAGARLLISTDLYAEIPEGHVGLLWSRSGLAVKHGIHVGAGCIDEGYQSEIKVLLFNMGEIDYKFKKGDRIAQLLTIPINTLVYKEAEEFTQSTERGEGGWGHTGE